MLNKKIDISNFQDIYPFKSNYMTLNGIKYHYIDQGQGDPIVMVHGNPTWSFYFRHLINILSKNYRTIAVDHIGCGLSDKPNLKQYDFRLKDRINDFENLINNHLKLDNITLIVHDWGGMIGMAFAVKYPEKISRIIITNTAAFLKPVKKQLPKRLKIIRNIALFAKPALLYLNLFAYSALFMASYKTLKKNVKIGLTAPYNCWNNRIATLKFVQDIPINEKDPSYDIVKKVDEHLYKLKNIPMLICWGQHDFVFDLEYLKEWQFRFPKAKVNIFHEAGHYLLEDEPDKVGDSIKYFLTNN